MNRRSRFMPPYVHDSLQGWRWIIAIALLFLLVGGYLWLLWRQPIATGLVTVAVIVWSMMSSRRDRQSIRLLAEARPRDSLCTFVRALPVRELDTWVIRAAYDGVRDYLSITGIPNFPLRPSDGLVEDLKIDPDELEDLATEIAKRAGRAPEWREINPYLGRVVSVEDLVKFVCAQPRSAT